LFDASGPSDMRIQSPGLLLLSAMSAPDPIRASLLRLRIIWAGILIGPIIFAVIVMTKLGSASASPDVIQMMTIISVAMLLVHLLIGYFLRGQIYKKNWVTDSITPQGYTAGNIILLGLLEVAAFVGLVTTLLAGRFGLATAAGGVALLFILINFPTGKPLEPALNPYQSLNGKKL